MSDLSRSFPVSVRVRTKHAEKTRVGLWGQSTIIKVVWDVTLHMSNTGYHTNRRKLKAISTIIKHVTL